MEQFSQQQFNEVTEAFYQLNQVPLTGHQQFVTYQQFAAIKPVYEQYKPVLDKYGISIRSDSQYFPDFAEYSIPSSGGLVGFYATGLGIPYTSELRLNPNITGSLEDYRESILSGFHLAYRNSGSFLGGGNIFDPIFSSPFSPVKFLNPISGVQQLESQFSSNPSTVLEQQIKVAVETPKVDYKDVALESGLNVAGSIGLGIGIEGASQGLTNYFAATTPLPSGVEGPVAPGFFESLGSGNFVNAYQSGSLAVSSAGSGLTSVSGFQSTLQSLGIAQAVRSIFQALDNTGKAVLQFLTGNIEGGIRTLTPGRHQPTTIFVNQGGSSESGGGGGGSRFNPSSQGFQDSQGFLPFVFFLGLLGVILYVVKRR